MRDIVSVRSGTAGVHTKQKAYFLLSASSAEASLLRAQLDDLQSKQRLVTRRLAMLEQRISVMRRNVENDRQPLRQTRRRQTGQEWPEGGYRTIAETRPAWGEIEMQY